MSAAPPPLTLRVDDLLVTPRAVTVPPHCPACGAALLAPAPPPARRALLEPPAPAPTLVHAEYQAQSRDAVVHADGEVDDALSDLPSSGEATISSAWSCAACGEVLAEARVTTAEPAPRG